MSTAFCIKSTLKEIDKVLKLLQKAETKVRSGKMEYYIASKFVDKFQELSIPFIRLSEICEKAGLTTFSDDVYELSHILWSISTIDLMYEFDKLKEKILNKIESLKNRIKELNVEVREMKVNGNVCYYTNIDSKANVDECIEITKRFPENIKNFEIYSCRSGNCVIIKDRKTKEFTFIEFNPRSNIGILESTSDTLCDYFAKQFGENIQVEYVSSWSCKYRIYNMSFEDVKNIIVNVSPKIRKVKKLMNEITRKELFDETEESTIDILSEKELL